MDDEKFCPVISVGRAKHPCGKEKCLAYVKGNNECESTRCTILGRLPNHVAVKSEVNQK